MSTPERTLASRISKVRVRGRTSPERVLMIGGAIAIGVGLPLILLGWWGASRTPYVFEQIPYLISGGLFGLALVVLGGLAYFAYWTTRQVAETRRQSDRLTTALSEIASLLAAPPVATASFVATAKGTMFHRRDCPTVAGRTDLRDVGGGSGLAPCKICNPS